MKMSMLSGVLLATVLGMSVSTAAERTGPSGIRPADNADILTAFAVEVSQQRDVRLAMAPIRSRAELAEYTARTPSASSPLSRLSPEARERFVRSLTFNERGVTGFRYADLEAELSATEAYRVLALFGVEDLVPDLVHLRVRSSTDQLIMTNARARVTPLMMTDYMNYWCGSRATCLPHEDAICTGNC
jgi:hypothetical protein